MNDKFFNLPLEKQQRIINAAYKVFSQSSYKKKRTVFVSMGKRYRNDKKGTMKRTLKSKEPFKKIFLILAKQAKK